MSILAEIGASFGYNNCIMKKNEKTLKTINTDTSTVRPDSDECSVQAAPADSDEHSIAAGINMITEGPIFSSFIRFALPLLLTSILAQSYSIVDGLILGNFIGEEALGSVNTISGIIDLLCLIQIGVSGGCSICLSHLFGAGRNREAASVIRGMTVTVGLLSVVMMAGGIILAHPLLRMLHVPVDVYDGALTYLRIVCIGVPFSSTYQLMAGVIRGSGDSRKPLGGIAIAAFINIGLDCLFVIALDMQIQGAALATIIAEALSCLFLTGRLRLRLAELCMQKASGGSAMHRVSVPELVEPCMQTAGSDSAMHGTLDAEPAAQDAPDSGSRSPKESILECWKLGIPQIIQSGIQTLGNILLQNITNLLGVFVLIGVTVCFKIDSLIVIPMIALSISTSVFTGQNTAARKPERVVRVLRIAAACSLATSAVMTVVLLLFSGNLLSLFGVSGNSEAVATGYIRICLPFYWVFGIEFILSGFLQGMKKTAFTSTVCVIALAARLLIAYSGAAVLGASILPVAEVASWIIQVAIMSVPVARFLKDN